MRTLAYIAKGIVAGGIAFCGSLGTALAASPHVTGSEWVAIAATTLTALGGVIAVPNGAKP